VGILPDGLLVPVLKAELRPLKLAVPLRVAVPLNQELVLVSWTLALVWRQLKQELLPRPDCWMLLQVKY
jgi:hypothetical protein